MIHARRGMKLLALKKMYSDFDASGIKIVDHAHDRNTTINNKIRSDRAGTNNSNDRWHATKGVVTGVRKIGSGSKRTREKTWSEELADKGALIRNHFYWAIPNAESSAEQPRQNLDMCITHFQNDHSKCSSDSTCRQPSYIPSFTVIKSGVAVQLLKDFVHNHVVYKNASDYVYTRDTGYIESCNNSALIYLDKLIHFQNAMYETRQNLWILDWNEHVDRPFTSRSSSMSVEHKRRDQRKKAP